MTYRLPTTITTTAYTPTDLTEHDAETTTQGYAAVVTGDGDGWVLRAPTRVTTVLPGQTNLVTVTGYDTEGRDIESRLPAGTADAAGKGHDAHATVTTYYTTAANATYPACGSAPAFAGLACRTGPAAQPGVVGLPDLPVTTYTYSMLSAVRTATETVGSTTRTTTTTYDAAGRITDPGYGYDAFGATTAVPAADAGGAALSIGYYANDLVASQTQAGVSKSWTLDPARRLRAVTDSVTALTSTNHYGDPGDSPSWIAVSDGSWSRNVVGLDGNLSAIQSSTGAVALQLTNLHGDIVATADDSTTATGISAYFESTEFGVPRDGNPVSPRYGWLGGKQRSGDTLGGLVLMGVRLYNPATGRFLSVDPVAGGSANNYDYCSGDPVNCLDLDGRFGFKWKKWLKRAAHAAQYMPGFIGTVANVGWGAYYAYRGEYGKAAASLGGAATFGVTRYTSAIGRLAQRSNALGKSSRLFGRGKRGLLNSNDYARIGWSWLGSAQNGRNMFRAAIGSKRSPIHIHYYLMRGVE